MRAVSEIDDLSAFLAGLTAEERRILAGLREKRLVAVPVEPTEAWWNSVAVRLDAHPSSLFMDKMRGAHAQLMLAVAQEARDE